MLLKMKKLKNEYNTKIKSIEDKISDITNLATKTNLNAKINEVKNDIPNIMEIQRVEWFRYQAYQNK